MHYYIYKITNLLNGKIYIGKHQTDDLDDGYMGSGKLLHRAYRKHGIENFKKEILMFCDSLEALNEAERTIVNQQFVDREDTYNIVIGGPNPIMHGELNPMFGKHPDVWNKGKKCPQISESLKGHKGSEKVVEHFRRLGKEVYKRPQNQKGFKHSDAFKEKHRQKCLGCKWWNDGTRAYFAKECPPGCVPGRLKRSK